MTQEDTWNVLRETSCRILSQWTLRCPPNTPSLFFQRCGAACSCPAPPIHFHWWPLNPVCKHRSKSTVTGIIYKSCTEYHWYCYRMRLFQLMPAMYLRDWNPTEICELWLLTTSEQPWQETTIKFTVALPCQSLCSNVCQNWPSKPTTLLKKTASFGTHSWRKWYSNYIYWQGI